MSSRSTFGTCRLCSTRRSLMGRGRALFTMSISLLAITRRPRSRLLASRDQFYEEPSSIVEGPSRRGEQGEIDHRLGLPRSNVYRMIWLNNIQTRHTQKKILLSWLEIVNCNSDMSAIASIYNHQAWQSMIL